MTATLDAGSKGECKWIPGAGEGLDCVDKDICDAGATMTVTNPGGKCIAHRNTFNTSWVYTPPNTQPPPPWTFHRATTGCDTEKVLDYYFTDPVAGNPPCTAPGAGTPFIKFGIKCPHKCP